MQESIRPDTEESHQIYESWRLSTKEFANVWKWFKNLFCHGHREYHGRYILDMKIRDKNEKNEKNKKGEKNNN